MSESRVKKPAFAARRRRAVRVSQEDLVKTGALLPQGPSPLLVEPRAAGVALSSWAASQEDWIEERLSQHGALLFRGFGIDSAARLEEFVGATSGGSLSYQERSSPRSSVGGKIYTSTDYPPEEEIYLHNEQSYNLTFPRKIYFCCLTAAESGGATPLADSRRVLERLAPKVRERFAEQGYLYVRNFGDGFGLDWRSAFQTDDPAAVEAYCRQNGIEAEWKEGDRLRTRQRRPVVARHPRSGELTWFNHLTFFHLSTLSPSLRQTFLEQLGAEALPNNTYYGDGSPIEPEVMEQLHAAYDQERYRFPWQEGDVLMLDNMLVAHGREPFSGPRKVVVGMADPRSWSDVLPAGSELPWLDGREARE